MGGPRTRSSRRMIIIDRISNRGFLRTVVYERAKLITKTKILAQPGSTSPAFTNQFTDLIPIILYRDRNNPEDLVCRTIGVLHRPMSDAVPFLVIRIKERLPSSTV